MLSPRVTSYPHCPRKQGSMWPPGWVNPVVKPDPQAVAELGRQIFGLTLGTPPAQPKGSYYVTAQPNGSGSNSNPVQPNGHTIHY